VKTLLTAAAIGLMAIVTSAQSTFDEGPDATLKLAGSYVARFVETFAAVIWREHYTQEDHAQRRFPASGTSFSQLVGRRELDSELLLLWLPRETSWIAVRDVTSVDGTPRRADQRRVQAALQSSDLSVDKLKALATENGRFNIGQIIRTFNEPTLALLFLDEHYRHRFSFRQSSGKGSRDDGWRPTSSWSAPARRSFRIGDGTCRRMEP